MEITTVGLDLAKRVFQVHGVDAAGDVVVRKALRRAQVLPFFTKLPSCLVGIEACGTSHHWARELIRVGHEVRLMPPAYVKPYVKRGKTDAADAKAICEAVTRPTMRFVAVKSREQTPLGPAVPTDCVNRPDRRLHPTNTPKHQIELATREPSTKDISALTVRAEDKAEPGMCASIPRRSRSAAIALRPPYLCFYDVIG